MRFVATRLSNRLLTVPKYGLLPNSDYNLRQKVDPIIYLTLESSKKGTLGNLHIRLFESIVPKTVENYKRMLLGSATYNNKSLSLLGSTFHQIFTNGFAASGRLRDGPMSIYGPTFRDESFEVLHTKPGLLSSVSNGNTNSSQWVLTLAPCPYLDHRNVVFGEVIHGHKILKAIESIGSKTGHIRDDIRIVSSGEIKSAHQQKHHIGHQHDNPSHLKQHDHGKHDQIQGTSQHLSQKQHNQEHVKEQYTGHKI